MFNVAPSVPAASGENETLTSHFRSGAKVAPQNSVKLNWEASPEVTLKEMGPIVAFVEPVFVSVRRWASMLPT